MAGAGGALFRTDVWLFNPDEAAAATATLVLHPLGEQRRSRPSRVTSDPITLAPRETRFFADVTLDTVPAGDGVVGALEWRSDRPLMASARIYTFTPTGTYGFFLPAIPIVRVHDAARRPTTTRARPPDLRHQLGRRELPDEPRRRRTPRA